LGVGVKAGAFDAATWDAWFRRRRRDNVLLLFLDKPHMGNGPLPIGSLHVRDFAPLRTQRRLAELTADARGFVRFSCLHCPRTGEVALADLRARFRPDEGLVNILNTLLPADCPGAVRDPSGVVRCGFCYSDLKRTPDA
jgi:hypothetical protein